MLINDKCSPWYNRVGNFLLSVWDSRKEIWDRRKEISVWS